MMTTICQNVLTLKKTKKSSILYIRGLEVVECLGVNGWNAILNVWRILDTISLNPQPLGDTITFYSGNIQVWKYCSKATV